MSIACRVETPGRLLKPKAMHTKLFLFVGTLIFFTLAFPITSNCQDQKQRQDPAEKQEESAITKVKILQNEYGEGRMILNDKSVYKKVKIHQIHDLWIVYIKNGSTHDMMKDQIDRIEYGREKKAILRFDDNGIIKIHIKR